MGFLFSVLVLVLDVWAIINVVNSRESGGGKLMWILGIVIFPLLGFLVWAFAGPKDVKRLPRR